MQTIYSVVVKSLTFRSQSGLRHGPFITFPETGSIRQEATSPGVIMGSCVILLGVVLQWTGFPFREGGGELHGTVHV